MATMYADLLRAAVACEDRASVLPTAELVREVAGPGGATLRPQRADGRMDLVDAVADQLRYDTHLVLLCRRFGVAVDLAAFGRPEVERDRLREVLGHLGVLPAAGGRCHDGDGRGGTG